jgi:HlyD family secretion protein
MRVSFTVDAYPGEPFRGSIRDIRNAPQVVSNVVTYDAVIDVANDELKLKPGMTATVSVITDRRTDVLSVPNAALRFRPDSAGPAAGPAAGQRALGGNRQRQQRGGEDGEGPRPVPKRTVYVLVNGEPQPREVSVGISDGRVTEITGGALKEGDLVIIGIAGQNPGQQRQGQRGFRVL